MTEHAMPAGIDTGRLGRLLGRYLRRQAGHRSPDGLLALRAGVSNLAFEPDLSAGEAAILGDILALCRSPLD